MEDASRLAVCDVRTTSSAWCGFGVATPSRLRDWSVDSWLLLDCSDDERRRRLGHRLCVEYLGDAEQYRSLGRGVMIGWAAQGWLYEARSGGP
jgi:hypothetical protein